MGKPNVVRSQFARTSLLQILELAPTESPPLWDGGVVSFEVLYERHHRLVYGVARRISQDPKIAEDITQAVFLKLWRAQGQLSCGNLAGWLSRVARNSSLDVMRRRSSTEVTLDPFIENNAAATRACDVLEPCTRFSIHAALAQLRREHREAIELAFFSGLTHVEIAHRMNAPVGTVKTWIRSGLYRLRDLLENGATTPARSGTTRRRPSRPPSEAGINTYAI